MIFNITGRHIEITDAMKAHAQEKAEKLPKYYDSITQVEILVDGQRTDSIEVEVIARAEHTAPFVATEIGDDAYACIDLAIHKIERQLHKKKTKERNNKHVADDKHITGA